MGAATRYDRAFRIERWHVVQTVQTARERVYADRDSCHVSIVIAACVPAGREMACGCVRESAQLVELGPLLSKSYLTRHA